MTTGRFIFKATLTIAFFSLMSKALGLMRDIVLAHQFGTSLPFDCYQIAIRLPNMLFAIVSGALVTVIVPVFVEYAGKGKKEEAWKIFNTVTVLLAVFYLVAALVGILAAPLLVKFLAPFYQYNLSNMVLAKCPCTFELKNREDKDAKERTSQKIRRTKKDV